MGCKLRTGSVIVLEWVGNELTRPSDRVGQSHSVPLCSAGETHSHHTAVHPRSKEQARVCMVDARDDGCWAGCLMRACLWADRNITQSLRPLPCTHQHTHHLGTFDAGTQSNMRTLQEQMLRMDLFSARRLAGLHA